MKILQVTHYMPPHRGGIEEVARRLVAGLSARGHELRWIASATPKPSGVDGSLVRIAAFNALEDRFVMPYPLWGPSALAHVMREVARADVVHVHDCLYTGSYLAALACSLLRRPLVLTQHVGAVSFGPWIDRAEDLAYRTVGRLVCSGAARSACCSPHVGEYFANLGGFPAFELIENGLDDTQFSFADGERRAASRRRLGISAANVVAFVGRLTAKKNLALALEATAQLRRSGTLLLVVGDGPEAHVLKGEAGVLHFPNVAPPDMPEFYWAADVLLLPSRGEGLPLSVQEALMTGLPVVVSDDPAFTQNLTAAAGVHFGGTLEELRASLGHALSLGPSRARSEYAKNRWGMAPFVDAYERLFAEARA